MNLLTIQSYFHRSYLEHYYFSDNTWHWHQNFYAEWYEQVWNASS